MKVREIMTAPAPSVTPETRVADVARLILERGTGGAAVVDGTGRLLGIVTEHDLVSKHARVHFPRYLGILGGMLPIDLGRGEDDLRRILGVTARDLMTEHADTIDPDADVDDAATLMVDRDANPLVVMEGDRVAGLLSHSDVIRLLIVEESDEGTAQGG